MTHIVMYKCREGQYRDEFKDKAIEAFNKLKEEIDGIMAVRVYTNCTKRDVNYDLCVMVDLQDEAAMAEYLPHPIHKAFSKYMDEFIESKARFDYE